jgi:CBS domain-containing protein
VTIEPQTASKIAVKPPTKRKQARRAIKRHRIARVPVAPPQPAQVGLFGAPPGG